MRGNADAFVGHVKLDHIVDDEVVTLEEVLEATKRPRGTHEQRELLATFVIEGQEIALRECVPEGVGKLDDAGGETVPRQTDTVDTSALQVPGVRPGRSFVHDTSPVTRR
jgi:hypothetical protein